MVISTTNCDKCDDNILLLSGTSNVALSKSIAQHLSLSLGKLSVKKFKDGELNIEIHEQIMSKNVFIIQSTCTPVNDNLMQLLLIISTCKAHGAKTITAVIPYFGYSRQDRRMKTQSPVSASTVANLIKSTGANSVITLDIHALHIISFFEPTVSTINIETQEFVSKEFLNIDLENPVIISPDAGGVARARSFKEFLNNHGLLCNDLAMFIKHRINANQVNDMIFIGDVKDRQVVIIDDIIDTAGTLVAAAEILKKQGAKKIFCVATHGIFSNPAIERIQSSPLDTVYITDTIQNEFTCNKIKKISIAPLISQTIASIFQSYS